MIVRHEDLIEKFEPTLRQIESKLALQMRHQKPRDIRQRMLPTDQPSKDLYDPRPFRKKQFLWELGPDVFKWVDRSIDWDVAASFGYKRLNLDLWHPMEASETPILCSHGG